MSENIEIVKGASLWQDAWKRLLKNKLAVFGLVVVAIMAIAVIIGPAIITWTTGFTYALFRPKASLSSHFRLRCSIRWGRTNRDATSLQVLQGGRISLRSALFDDCLAHRRVVGARPPLTWAGGLTIL